MQEAKMHKGVPNHQTRALAIAMGGATVASVATMFVPVVMLEAITGSTGLSELVPAAAAPLGDTARALIAFGTGALTLAVLAFVLLRRDSAPAAHTAPPASDWASDETVSFRERLARIALPAISLPKMPWKKGEDDITDLADLPKLKNGDSHPDAPARRPLVASLDLPMLDLAETPAVAKEPAAVEIEPARAQDAILMPEIAQPAPVHVEPVTPVDVEPTLAEMVAQLEAAVSERQKQLAELEAVATRLAADRPLIQRGVVDANAEPDGADPANEDSVVGEPGNQRPPLEAVPSSSVKDDDMDSALAAALQTLHRMNATAR
ncbi:MAG: hypothetical protein IBJ12_03595 [Sphingomonadaceae bacterium]|nr:hypothetical protein [Sphingomonadaceae bacterium]